MNFSSPSVLLKLALFAVLLVTAAAIRQKRSDAMRCKWTNGVLCRWTCRGLGHSDGTCDDNDDCRCSEENLERYVCGGGDGRSEGDGLDDVETADALCAGWCQFKGKQTGDCDLRARECVCSKEELDPGHVKCVTDAVCSVYCQFKGKSTGRCGGKHEWDCQCVSNNDVVE